MTITKLSTLTLLILYSVVDSSLAADPKSADKPQEPTVPNPEAITYDYNCSSNVSYSWKIVPEPGKRPPSSPSEPKTVLFNPVQATDSTEESAKLKLDQAITKTKQAALADCQQKHENTSLCLATRLKSISDSYDQFDFQTRKFLMEAAKKDCESQAGECLSISSSEVSCLRVEKKQFITQPTASSGTKPEDEKKGAKKK